MREYVSMGLNVRRNILHDPARRVVRIVDWDKAPTVMDLAPDFREVPLGRLITTGCTIENIELDEAVRGIGLGRAVVGKLKDNLKRGGCEIV
ncbi:MAG: hypothetical protein ACO2O2_05410 [Acidilobaceae archaeon]